MFPVLNILEYFGTHIHKFLSRNIYLGMGLLGRGMCIYLYQILPSWFLKVLYHFSKNGFLNRFNM